MPPDPRKSGPIVAILHHEAAGGLLLIAAAALALIVANSPLGHGYEAVLHAMLGPLSLHHWINDGLMAAFFLVVGLEVKREWIGGALSRPGTRLLPITAALGGMIVPTAIYLLVAGGAPGASRGWAVPAATDIAFAQAVLLLAGSRAPPALRLFLTALAIIDDIGAVAIIAFGYTARIDPAMLGAGAAILAVMWLLARRGVDRAWPYLLLAVLLWIATYRSGVHATVAGVLAAFVIPVAAGRNRSTPLAAVIETALHPWVTFAIVPLFGFANAGLALHDIRLATLLEPIPLGIALGLFLGKQVGVGLGTAIPIACGLARRPDGASGLQIYAVTVLAGIGFTMSLFIGGLAFPDAHRAASVRLGVLVGSVASAMLGYAALRLAPAKRPRADPS